MLEWWHILLIILGGILLLFLLSLLLYKQFFKRFWDIILSGLAIIILSPLLIVLTIVGAIAMKGNPFFTQERPGKREKIFKLIKFRSMNNKKNIDGSLLPDEQRVSKYGTFLRKTSLDELPELFNIFIGDMSIVGPRPLLADYLPYYTEKEKHRHDVRPGLTGLAQVKGRSFLTWEEIFEYDLQYVEKHSVKLDIAILLCTIGKVFKRGEIADVGTVTVDENGATWVVDNGVKRKLHRPLNQEREHDA